MCTGPNGTYPLGMVLNIKNYALHGLISHMDHSNVNHISSLILSNICIKTMIYRSIAQRHYKDLPYKVEKKDKIPYWASIHKERKFSKGFHPSIVNEVKWFKGCRNIRVEWEPGMHDVICGCLCRRWVVPVMDAIFPSPFLPLLFSFICFFFFFFFLFKG